MSDFAYMIEFVDFASVVEDAQLSNFYVYVGVSIYGSFCFGGWFAHQRTQGDSELPPLVPVL